MYLLTLFDQQRYIDRFHYVLIVVISIELDLSIKQNKKKNEDFNNNIKNKPIDFDQQEHLMVEH